MVLDYTIVDCACKGLVCGTDACGCYMYVQPCFAFARLCQIPLIHHPTPLLIELSTVRAYKLLHIYSRHLALIIINSGFDLGFCFLHGWLLWLGKSPTTSTVLLTPSTVLVQIKRK